MPVQGAPDPSAAAQLPADPSDPSQDPAVLAAEAIMARGRAAQAQQVCCGAVHLVPTSMWHLTAGPSLQGLITLCYSYSACCIVGDMLHGE